MDDTDAGSLFELISNFQVKLEILLEQYNETSAKVTQLDPNGKHPSILPNDLSAEVWQSAKQAVKEKISLKYEANASFKFIEIRFFLISKILLDMTNECHLENHNLPQEMKVKILRSRLYRLLRNHIF